MDYIKKILFHYRNWVLSRHVTRKNGFVTVGDNVRIVNYDCISFEGKCSIGNFSSINPIKRYGKNVYSPTITIGGGTIIGAYCSLNAIMGIKIGANVLFANYVHVSDHSHGYEDIIMPITPQDLICKGSVIIDDDCWLGYNVEILSGVHIGKHCVIGARSVVTKDVPAYSVAVGNPARVVKQYNFELKKWEKSRM